MPSVTLNDITLHYEDVSPPATVSETPLLLIAGLASDSASWAPVAGRLAQTRRLILPDNRGAGRTRPLDAPIGVTQMADDCAALLDALGVPRAHVCGHSMGGLIAAHLAARHPGKVGKLIIAASAPSAPGRNRALFQALRELRASGVDEALWHRMLFFWLFRPAFFEAPGVVEMAVREAMAYPHRQERAAFERQVEAAFAEPLALDLTQIPHPTLVLLGADDLLFPAQDAAAAYAGLSNVRIETIAEAAHSLHWDRPAAFCDFVQQFLD